MARFKIGDRVRIVANEPTPFATLEAAIRQVRLNGRGVTGLDQYVVVFGWGEEQTFYDVQLQEAGKISGEQEIS